LSHLDAAHRPAGVDGRVRVEGDALVFGDGRPARFWGTNLSGDALFEAERDDVADQARRLAAFGFNLVRIHHQDSAWVVPNVFGRDPATTRVLDETALAAIDWWIACLEDEGIYVWLDLHVGREFLVTDGITDYAELLRAPTHRQGKGFAFVNASIEARLQETARAYLDHENHFTGRRYRDDPGVLAVLLTNENDLTAHFGALVTRSPRHAARYERAAEAFAPRHDLDPAALLRPWEPGPAQWLAADLEAGLFTRGIADLRGQGYAGLVATTSAWGGGPEVLPSLALGDVVDVHTYGGAEVLSVDPRVAPHFLLQAAEGQVAGKPMTLTEWNIPVPAWDRFVGPPMMAAMASLQGWDAPMMFSYLSHRLAEPTRTLAEYSSFADPAIMAMMPLAALAYRRGDIALARQTYVVTPEARAASTGLSSPGASAAVRTLAERSRVVAALPDRPELSWDRAYEAPGAIVIDDLAADHLGPDATSVTSDTGEIRRDWAAGVMTIDTPRTQVAMGWLGGGVTTLSDMRTQITTAKAAVGIVSLDDEPLSRSTRMLLTVVARAHPPDPVASAPLRAEPVRGTISVRSEHAHLTITPQLGAAPTEASAPSFTSDAVDGWHDIELPEAATHWYLVTVPATQME
jgi:hypothetical protein